MAHRYKELAINDNTFANYEEDEALEWRQMTHDGPKKEVIDYSAPVNIPDMIWIIPSHFTIREILGEKNNNLRRIAEYTNAHIAVNKSEYRIDMWGERDALEDACHQWNTLADNMLAEKRKKSKSWGKPEKAPTSKKQKEKMNRRKKREEEEEIYKKLPKPYQFFPFYGYFTVNTDIPVTQFIGEKGEYLNSLRIETKCHIWYDPLLPGSKITIKIAGNSHGSVEEATARVKHIFIKTLASRSIPSKGWVLHMIDPPPKPYKVRLARPPSWFHQPYDYNDEYRLLEPVYDGGERIPVVGEVDTPKEVKTSYSEAMRKIRDSNIQGLENTLVKALEAVYLHDLDIKMRVRFGHLCLISFPKRKGSNEEQILWSIEKFDEKVLKHARMQSKFATCLGTEHEQLSRLLEFLSGSEYSKELNNSPFREFKIRGVRKVPIPDSKERKERERKREERKREERWPCAFDIQFDKIEIDKKIGEKGKNIEEDDENDAKYKVGLWNAVINERNILDINMSCLKSDYSWKLNIQTAKCLSNGRFHPEGNFVYRLRFCPRGRLVFSNTNEVEVESVCEKTKWKYWWSKDYIIEVTRYEYWDLSKYMETRPGIEIPLSQEQPPKVSYGVSFYKKTWDEEFVHNRNLKVGEVPEWHPHDVKDKETGVKAWLIDIQNFLRELQSNLPMPTAE